MTAGICPGRKDAAGIGRACVCEALGDCQETGFIFVILGGS